MVSIQNSFREKLGFEIVRQVTDFGAGCVP